MREGLTAERVSDETIRETLKRLKVDLAAGEAMDYESRPGVCSKKKQRDRLMRLALEHPEWALGF